MLEIFVFFGNPLQLNPVYDTMIEKNFFRRLFMKKIAIFMADGLEEIEGLTVVDILRRAEIDVTMVSISKKKEVTGSHNIKFQADKLFGEVNFEEIDGVVLPGGMPGTTNLMNHAGVKEIIKKFATDEKLVSAICAAPSVLGQAGILEGKKATCYPGFEDQMTGAVPCSDKVVQDGNVITSRGMGTAIPFALALTGYFLGQEAADELGASIMYYFED